MTAAEALAAAKAEGLILTPCRADNVGSRYKHVAFKAESKARPYRLTVSIQMDGKPVVVKRGRFATAEEAALEAARYHASAPRVPCAPRGGATDGKRAQATVEDDEDDTPLSKRCRRCVPRGGATDGKRAQATVEDDEDSEDDTPLSKRCRRCVPRGGATDGKRAQATVEDDEDSEDDTPLSQRCRS
jgi:hypothetical protein